MSDIGRPVAHIVSNPVGYDHLPVDTRAVLDTQVPKEIETETTVGKWYTLRIQPYRTVDKVIEEAVRMYGWSEAEALTMNVRSLIPEELREKALAVIQELSLAEILKPYYTQSIAKDGTIVDVSMVSTALMNEAHHIYAITTTERVKGQRIGRKKKLLR